jgi:hypothetical protein
VTFSTPTPVIVSYHGAASRGVAWAEGPTDDTTMQNGKKLALNTECMMSSAMTPTKALAWTLAYVLAAASLFWSLLSDFVGAAYRYWFVDLFFLCFVVLLSWFVYRSYRKGSTNSFSAKLPKNERRGLAIVGVVIFICSAVLQIIRASSASPGNSLSYFAAASVWLVLAADNWRRYLQLKGL